MNELTKNEVSELYYLAHRQYLYYYRKVNREKFTETKRFDYLLERTRTFHDICSKLLSINPDVYVSIDELRKDEK